VAQRGLPSLGKTGSNEAQRSLSSSVRIRENDAQSGALPRGFFGRMVRREVSFLPVYSRFYAQFPLISAPFGQFPLCPLLPDSPKEWLKFGAETCRKMRNGECCRFEQKVGFKPVLP